MKDSFNSYPLDRLAQAGAVAAIEDEAYFQASRAMVMGNRDALSAGLAALGFEVLPSSANFVFARHEKRSGAELTAALRERRCWCAISPSRARIAPYLRISVGVGAEIARLLAALKEILSGEALSDRNATALFILPAKSVEGNPRDRARWRGRSRRVPD